MAGGIDLEGDGVQITPVPGVQAGNVNFGVSAAKALADGKINGFWANGMGTEVAVRDGVGTVVLDVRRGDGPPGCFDYTFASVATTDKLIEATPEIAAAAVSALVAAQEALIASPGIAARVGEKLFPPTEASLITQLVARDVPYYNASISRQAVDGMNNFARSLGLRHGHPVYADVVSGQFTPLWKV